MFDVMVESRVGRGCAARRAAVPVALSLHAVAVGGLLAASMLAIRQVSDPERILVSDLVWVPFRPAPALGDGGAPSATGIARPVPTVPRGEIVQPTSVVPPPSPETPVETIEDAPSGSFPAGAGDGFGGGRPGVPWGVPGGLGDGAPGGVPDGAGVPAAPSSPVALAPDMEPPRLVTRVSPEYPAIAIRARLEGRVVVQAVIGEDGSVEDVEVLTASSPVFTEAAAAAVRAWKYRPALQNGRPVKVYFTVRVEFRLD